MLSKPNSIPHHIYMHYRNKVNSEIRRAKKLYYKEAFVRVIGNSKKTWNIVNNILQSSKKKDRNCIKSVIFNNTTYETDPQIVHAFNDHFSTVGSRIDSFLQRNSSSAITPSQYLSNFPIQNSFFFNQTTSLQVENIIMSRPNKSSHISTYSIKVIKHLSILISPILAILINRSVCTGTFPQILKIARVVSVFKSGDCIYVLVGELDI